MADRYEILTFDCYGTLIDWERGIGDAFEAALPAAEKGRDRAEILRLHAEIEPGIQAAAYRPYREVLDRTAARIAERLGLSSLGRHTGFLSESLPRWPPFADTETALRRLRQAGYRLGILSNVDDDLLGATLGRLEVDFELLVTAQQVRSYKPARAHFDAARERIGGRPWMHVAQSLFHDIAPARELAIPVSWIDRKGESTPAGWAPLRRFRDLNAFADELASGPPGARR